MDRNLYKNAIDMMTEDDEKEQVFKVSFYDFVMKRKHEEYFCKKCKDNIDIYDINFTKYVDKLINKEDICFEHSIGTSHNSHLTTIKGFNNESENLTLIDFEHRSA